MIEEEEDEDILKKKSITLKSVLKNLLVIGLILIGALFIYFGSGDMFSNWMVGFMLICFGTTIMQIQKPPSEPIRQTLTILMCNLCGLSKVRHYQSGDFVFRTKDECDQCDGKMEIKNIYSVKLKKPTEESKKEFKHTEPKDPGEGAPPVIE